MSELEMRGYAVLLERVKSEVQSARTRAALAVNRELVELYWRLGRLILDRQDAETYGTKVIERLAADLRVGVPRDARPRPPKPALHAILRRGVA